MNRLLLVSLLLCTCTLACAGPGLFGGEQRTLLRLYDADTGVRLELANESHPELRDVYSRQRPEASLKLAPDDLVEALLDRLEELGFERFSAPGGPPEGAGLKGWLEVSTDGQTRTFAVPGSNAVPGSGPTREQLSAFAYMQLVVSETYTHVGGLQYIENPQGGELLRRQPQAHIQPKTKVQGQSQGQP